MDFPATGPLRSLTSRRIFRQPDGQQAYDLKNPDADVALAIPSCLQFCHRAKTRMSFGFSVGDFIAILQLAIKVRKEFIGAPDQFKNISEECVARSYRWHLLTVLWNRIRRLAIVLQDADISVSECELNDQQQAHLQEFSCGCRSVLEKVEKTLGKYGELDSSNRTLSKRVKRVWKRFTWEPEDIRELRDQITVNITLLNTFLEGISR